MRYRRHSEVVYRNGFMMAIVVLIASVWVIGAIGAVVSGNEAAAIIVPVALTAGPVVTYVSLQRRVVLRESEVLIYGYVFHETVPYNSITGALFTGEFAGYRWLEIHHRGGWSVGVHPYLASGIPFVDPLWQRRLAVEIMERAKHAVPNATGD